MKNILFTIRLLLTIALLPQAHAQTCTGCALEYTQKLNNAELGVIAGTIGEQLLEAQKVVEDLQKNSVTVSQHTWGNTLAQLEKLADISAESAALAYDILDISEHYRVQLPGYDGYKTQLDDTATPSDFDYETQYQRWAQINADNIEQSMMILQEHHAAFTEEDAQLQAIRSDSQDATSRMAAMQVANQLANQQVNQLQQLRQLVMTQIQLLSNYMAVQHDKAEMQYAMEQQYYDPKTHASLDISKRYGVIK